MSHVQFASFLAPCGVDPKKQGMQGTAPFTLHEELPHTSGHGSIGAGAVQAHSRAAELDTAPHLYNAVEVDGGIMQFEAAFVAGIQS